MCNLYSITINQAAIIALFRVINRYVGNLPPMPGVFPDYPAPVVRNAEGGRELTIMRWGMPPPPRTGGPPVTNIRNTSSPHWRGWLKPENRCLVPVNSFAEYAPEPNPETKKKDVVWFVLDENRPLFSFAGIWTEFQGDRGTKSKPIPGPHDAYGFLTTAPNAVVEPIHPKAMPVILTTEEERDVWMRAPSSECIEFCLGFTARRLATSWTSLPMGSCWRRHATTRSFATCLSAAQPTRSDLSITRPHGKRTIGLQ
jgi:putative SOS response-associated peptidase YedK